MQLSSCSWSTTELGGSSTNFEGHFSDSSTQRQELTQHKQTSTRGQASPDLQLLEQIWVAAFSSATPNDLG